MNELLEAVLNDVSARDDSELPSLASDMADKFLPWGSIAES